MSIGISTISFGEITTNVCTQVVPHRAAAIGKSMTSIANPGAMFTY